MNLLENFKKFGHHAELIFKGALADKTEEMHVTCLLLWVGEKGQIIYNTLTVTNDERKKVGDICLAFKNHVQPNSIQFLIVSNLTTRFRGAVRWNSL